MEFRSNRLEHTVGCGLKNEMFGLEPTTPPLSPQCQKEGLSKTSGTKTKLCCGIYIFPSRISSCACFPTKPHFFEINAEPISTRFDFVLLDFA